MIQPVFLVGPDDSMGFTNLALEAGPAGNRHAAGGAGFQMLPPEFTVAIRRVRRQIKEPRHSFRATPRVMVEKN
jgi:hypothetical protein